ncbi:SET-domain containing protein lysinemethyltransferase family protein [Striga asiatica]|uniref:SET-domain containing protein lysinemethyltransferase family protein n=1 Tax=Striga asiatica TaxID=4170 RepID=A0A5A7QY21_STRAF|nr:SET-domain containing protein lysinemethyltransferase family protein [Striga asiatica]
MDPISTLLFYLTYERGRVEVLEETLQLWMNDSENKHQMLVTQAEHVHNLEQQLTEAQLNQVEHHVDHYYQQHQMEQERCEEMEHELVDKEHQIAELDSKVKNLELELKVKDDAMARMEVENQRLRRRVSLGGQRIDILECQFTAERLVSQQPTTLMGP